jgi:hypothetical protein
MELEPVEESQKEKAGSAETQDRDQYEKREKTKN